MPPHRRHGGQRVQTGALAQREFIASGELLLRFRAEVQRDWLLGLHAGTPPLGFLHSNILK